MHEGQGDASSTRSSASSAPSSDSLVVDEATGDWGRATATFSADRRHRYLLTRHWSSAAGRVNFIMLNPSTADAFVLDPTNRRCVGFARDWGFGGLVTTNVFAWRSTDPKGLRVTDDPVGPANDEFIVESARSCELVVAAWGVHAVLGEREAQVRSLLRDAGVEVQVLRLTKQGHPGHPLYVAADTRPVAWAT